MLEGQVHFFGLPLKIHWILQQNRLTYGRFPWTPYVKPKDAIKPASSNDANKNKSNPTKAWISSTDNPNPSSSTTNNIYKSIHAFRYKDLVIFRNFVVQVLKLNSAPRNVGIANPAFTMNEYYPIHLTPPGQGLPNSPNKYERRFGWLFFQVTRSTFHQNISQQTLQEIVQWWI